jgi:hypothetical protein
MSWTCPEGHASDEQDYCSVCGAKIAPRATGPAGATGPAHATHHAPAGGEHCPICGEPRAAETARFCEVCRHDFVASGGAGTPRPPAAPPGPARPGNAPQATATASPWQQSTGGSASPPAPAAAQPHAGPFAAVARWQLEIHVDPALDVEPDPASPCPHGVPATALAVGQPELLVGRRDDRRDIKPDVPLNDPGASRRHAKFVLAPDGLLALQDLASTNGTKLNGVEVEPGSRRPLRLGDEVTLGRWTRIVVRSAP